MLEATLRVHLGDVESHDDGFVAGGAESPPKTRLVQMSVDVAHGREHASGELRVHRRDRRGVSSLPITSVSGSVYHAAGLQ